MHKKWVAWSALAMAALVLASCKAKETPVLTTVPDPWKEEVPATLPYSVLTAHKAGDAVFTGNEWTGKSAKMLDGTSKQQSEVVSVNTMDYHSSETLMYQSVEEARLGAMGYEYERSDYYQLLTGEGKSWSLAVYENISDAKKAGVYDQFYTTDYDMTAAPKYEGNNTVGTYETAYYGGFKDVTLPASWQTQGFDFPIYSNYTYPWNTYKNGDVRLPNAPTQTNPVGFYRTTFTVDESWLAGDRSTYIAFGGVDSCYYVWVNGHQVGYAEGSYDLSEFDLTPYLNYDGSENLLAVMVIRWCDGSYFENQDFLRLAGIFRDVWLYSTPGVQMYDYSVVTDLDSTYTDATLKINLDLFNKTMATIPGKFSVDVKLFDADGNNLFAADPLTASMTGELASGKTETMKLSREVKAPHLWSDEDPYLYTLVISLYDADGNYYGSMAQQLGFRELTFTKTIATYANNTAYKDVLLNGKKILLKGVNRHDNEGSTGKYVSRETYQKDVEIMKQLNVNALRTSHYPNDKYMYYLCDRYGILVLAEANVEDHYNVGDSNTARYFNNVITDRVMSLLEREKNRTSVLIWSLGNELSQSAIYPQLIKQIKKIDATRMVHLESYGTGGGVDVGSGMYWSIEATESMGKASNNMPWLHCEYAHAMGNSAGNLYEYWQVIRSYDNLLGAFIWDFVDQTIYTQIPNKTNDYLGTGYYYAYGGAWGDKINSADFCQNGIVSPDRTLQPECAEVKYVYQNIWFASDITEIGSGMVKVYNEFKFTDLSAYAYTYELRQNGKVVDSGSLTISCAPGETIEITVPYQMPAVINADDEFSLVLLAKLKEDTAWEKAGYVIASESFDLPVEVAHTAADRGKVPSLIVTETEDAILVKGVDFEASFTKKDGALATYLYKGESLLCAPLTPTYRRAQISNDKNNFWDSVGIAGVDSLTYETAKDGKSVDVVAVLSLRNAGSSKQTMRYTVYGSGEVGINATLDVVGASEMARYGLTLTLPASYENTMWYGYGEADGFVDRMLSGLPGIYTSTVTDNFYPYGKPQDTGNKMGVRWYALTSDDLNTGLLAVSDSMEAQALHYTAANLKSVKYTYQLPTNLKYTYLTLSYMSRGTGGASCGPDTLPDYRIPVGEQLTFSLTIVPFEKGADADALTDLSRLWRDSESIGAKEMDAIIAGRVDTAIEGLLSDASKLDAVRAQYDALTDAQKKLVSKYDILTYLENQVGKDLLLSDLTGGGRDVTLKDAVIFPDEDSPAGAIYSGNFVIPDSDKAISGALSGKNQFTIVSWVKFADLGEHNIIFAKGDTQVAVKTNSGGQLEFYVYDGGWKAVTTGVSAGKWMCIAAVRDGAGLKLYVNGSKVAETSFTGSVSTNSYAPGVGIDKETGRSFRGMFAGMQIYDRALSASEIASLTLTAPIDGAIVAYDVSKCTVK